MDNVIVWFLGAGIMLLLSVVAMVGVAAMINPKWFSRSFASTFGGFAGASAAMIAVVILGCICLALGCGVVLFMISQLSA